ncbi:MAG: hypothetical protein RIG62_30425 [Cyclobacteriaceae bacterium]
MGSILTTFSELTQQPPKNYDEIVLLFHQLLIEGWVSGWPQAVRRLCAWPLLMSPASSLPITSSTCTRYAWIPSKFTLRNSHTDGLLATAR